ENAVAPSTWTLPSHDSLVTGLDSVRHGSNYGDAVAESFELLAERLRDAGYQTVAFTGGGYVRPSFGLAQGFDRFTYWRDSHRPEDHARVGGDLDANLAPVLEWLGQERHSPFFLFFQTYEVHAPYTDRQPWFDQLSEGEHTGSNYYLTPRPGTPDPESGWRYDSLLTRRIEGQRGLHPIDSSYYPLLRTLYDSGVARADDAVGQVLDRLASLGLEDDTVVIVTSDHGEALGEKDMAGHAFLYDFNLMIPLIVGLPDGRGGGSRVGAQVRLIDVAPTIAELVDLPPVPDIDGLSLLPYWDDPERQEPRTAESYAGSSNWGMSVRAANRWKYIYQHSPWRPLHGQEELFDLETDPAEELNVAGEEAGRTQRFREALASRFETHSSHLHVRLQNQTEHTLRYEVRSHIASTVTVKAVETPWCQEDEPECVAWIRGWTVVTLEPGESASLFLEGSPFNELKVRMSSRSGAGVIPPEKTFKLYLQEVLERPYRLRLEAGEWRRLDAGEGLDLSQTGVELVWKNSLWDEATDGGTQVDEETRRQLDALGYAN
ncbi:MAG: sulfatase-like hydrolase/transferase, partial [Holophagales bacterium]|nr:sulfatase-like hydrolase/transferase [Holophagales bacterium]